MVSDILDPSALLSKLPSLLPQQNKQLSTPTSALAALTHSVFTTLGFRLVGTDDASSSTRSFTDNVLNDGWSSAEKGCVTLKYKHEQSSLEFVLKVMKLGGRTVITAVAVEDDKLRTLSIRTDDFTSPSFFPHSDSSSQPLVHGFISSHRIADFVSQLKLSILQPLLPGLRKEGYTETPESSSSSSGPQPDRNTPRNAGPSRPEGGAFPPARSPPGMGSHIPPSSSPFSIGRSDLDPLAAQNHPNPFAPPPLFPPAGGDDGMFVGPNHPIFNNTRPRRDGPFGPDGFLPPLAAPPGARFDPVGPMPPLGGFGGGRRHPPRSGDPDNDEFMPPGAVSDQ